MREAKSGFVDHWQMLSLDPKMPLIDFRLSEDKTGILGSCGRYTFVSRRVGDASRVVFCKEGYEHPIFTEISIQHHIGTDQGTFEEIEHIVCAVVWSGIRCDRLRDQ